MQTLDYSRISDLTSQCEDAIHRAEHATQSTIGNIRERAQKTLRRVTDFLNSGVSPELRKAYANSIGILTQRRDRLDMLLSRAAQKVSKRGRLITKGKAQRYGVRVS